MVLLFANKEIITLFYLFYDNLIGVNNDVFVFFHVQNTLRRINNQ